MIQPSRAAVVVVDMWDRHWCQRASVMIDDLAQRLDPWLECLRSSGVTIVHCPSDTTNYYREHPARKALKALPEIPRTSTDTSTVPKPPMPEYERRCPCKPLCYWDRNWSRQHPAIKIDETDYIVNGNTSGELDRICRHFGIQHLVYVGEALNKCILDRKSGIRSMLGLGYQCYFIHDMTITIPEHIEVEVQSQVSQIATPYSSSRLLEVIGECE